MVRKTIKSITLADIAKELNLSKVAISKALRDHPDISTSTKKIVLLVSVILLSAGLTLLLVDSSWKLGSFIQSVLSVVNFLWPIAIIIVILVLLLRIK